MHFNFSLTKLSNANFILHINVVFREISTMIKNQMHLIYSGSATIARKIKATPLLYRRLLYGSVQTLLFVMLDFKLSRIIINHVCYFLARLKWETNCLRLQMVRNPSLLLRL